MTEFNDVEITKIIEVYKKQRERDRKRWLVRKQNPEFMESNRLRAKAHYEKNKQNKKDNYEKNKDFHKTRALFNYYKRNNRIQDFVDKYPDGAKLLENHGVVLTTISSNSSSSV